MAAPATWPEQDGQPALACLVFGVGQAGARWLARLGGSDWFSGLEPGTAYAAASGTVAASFCSLAAGHPDGRRRDIEARVADAVARSRLPDVPIAMVAAPRESGPDELAAALGLVRGLRARRGARGCRTVVVVTAEAEMPHAAGGFTRALRDRGAFVVRAGLGASGDHLHHFPLRAITMPRHGRLICVDMADFLACWQPGRVADLHVIPFDFDAAARAFSRLLAASKADARPLGGMNLLCHLDPARPGATVAEIDRLAMHGRDLLLGPDADMAFTTADRLDGRTGTADLLLIRDAPAPETMSASVVFGAHYP